MSAKFDTLLLCLRGISEVLNNRGCHGFLIT